MQAVEKLNTKAKKSWLKSAPEKINIADDLSEDELSNIGDRVVREYDLDLSSRSDWDEKMRGAMKLALQVKEAKSWPWPGAANVKFPLLTVAAIQFAARAYPAIVDGTNVVKGKVNGDDSGQYNVPIDPNTGQPAIDPETGEVISEEIVPPGFKQARADRIGRHMSWQLVEEMEEWEPDMDRLLHVLPITGVVFKKTYYDVTLGRNCSQMLLPDQCVVNYGAKSLESAPRITHRFELYPYEIKERIRSGLYLDDDYIFNSTDDEDAPEEFLEQDRRLDLDEDGYAEPYLVTVHKESGKVARIRACFESDAISLNDKGEVVRIEKINYYTKYGFIPNPESAIYDLGFGVLLGPISETVNTLINQMLDAGTIQNAGGGFIGDGLKIKGGALRYTPGEFKRVNSNGQKIAENIYHMQHAGPSAVLFQLLGVMIDAGKEIASVKDILTGESQGANASPTTTIALIEQGLKTFTSIFKRIHRSLKFELRILYDLNRRYLDEEKYFRLLDKPEAVAPEDYEDETLDVTPVSDPAAVTDMQQIGRAQFLMQFNGDPYTNQQEIRERVWRAAKIEDIDKILTQPPEPGPDPKILKDQMDAELKNKQIELDQINKDREHERQEINDFINNLKTIADTEAVEMGSQLQTYITQLERLMNEDNNRRLGTVAGASGDGNVSQVSGGPVENAGGNPQAPVAVQLPGPVDSNELGNIPG